MSIKSIFLSSLLGAAGGFGASLYALTLHQETIQDRLSQTPPVAVIDFVKIASSYPEGADQDEIERLMIKTNDAVVKLKEAGFLIIDASSVVGAPDDIHISPKVILE